MDDIEYLGWFVESLTDAEIDELNRLSEETRADPVSWAEVNFVAARSPHPLGWGGGRT